MPAWPINSDAPGAKFAYRYPYWSIVPLAVVVVALYLALEIPIEFMVQRWGLEEFSHGYLIPFIVAYLVWQRRNRLRNLDFKGVWVGVAVVMAGIALAIAGRLSTLVTVQQLALLVIIAGLVMVAGGRLALHVLRMPLLVLVFMIPLPMFIMNSLSSELQLISSTIGVWLMRLAGVAAFLEGNVIDLGSVRLEVAEACSGLRYLLPLMTLAFLTACMYRAAIWKRALIFVSSIPITLALNSLRIGMVGVMVDRWGLGMAEGAIHAVQGWMMFMLSTGLLFLEVLVLARIGKDRRPWQEVFGLEAPALLPSNLERRVRRLPAAAWIAGALIVLFAIASRTLPTPRQIVPSRQSFASFPLHIGEWSGRRLGMESVYLDTLKLDDYILADFSRDGAGPINFYVAWYDQQTTGESTHSPKGCLPGGGWRIQDFVQISLTSARVGGHLLKVNRALIQHDNQRELVYYWFQQRGRVVTNEYLVKWYLLVDSVLRHRTDGALVRLIVPITPTMTEASADRVLSGFLATIGPQLDPYLPG